MHLTKKFLGIFYLFSALAKHRLSLIHMCIHVCNLTESELVISPIILSQLAVDQWDCSQH